MSEKEYQKEKFAFLYDKYYKEATGGKPREELTNQEYVRADNLARTKAARDTYDEFAGVDLTTKTLIKAGRGIDKIKKKAKTLFNKDKD